jgi:molecular chaperone GrpE (heat shock protein)
MNLFKKIARIFKRNRAGISGDITAEPIDNMAIALQSEIAGLQLTIKELKNELSNQQALLADSEKNRQAIVNETVDAKLQKLFGELASPLSQLALLQSLFVEGKEVKTANIFKLVAAIESSLTDKGLSKLHEVNEICLFDATTMDPIKSGITFAPGEKIRVRLPGYSLKGNYLCKSLVDKTE